MTEEVSSERGPGLTRVAWQDVAGGDADLQEPHAVPSSLARAEVRGSGRVRVSARGLSAHRSARATRTSQRGMPPFGLRHGAQAPATRSSAFALGTPRPDPTRPQDTPPTAAQVHLVPPPAPDAGSSRGARRENYMAHAPQTVFRPLPTGSQ